MDALHIERKVLERVKKPPGAAKPNSVNFKQYYRSRTEVIPALVK